MGSLKRKSEEVAAEAEGASQKQQKKENGCVTLDDEAVACLHDVSYPEGFVVPPSSSSASAGEASEPAKKFNFTLDPFQSEAIKCLEKAESVMVISFNDYFFFNFF